MNTGVIVFMISLILSFVITVVIALKIIPILKKKKLGQKILEIGPNWHKSKEGTPTMCGIIFIIAIAVAFLVTALIFKNDLPSKELLITVNILIFSLITYPFLFF